VINCRAYFGSPLLGRSADKETDPLSRVPSGATVARGGSSRPPGNVCRGGRPPQRSPPYSVSAARFGGSGSRPRRHVAHQQVCDRCATVSGRRPCGHSLWVQAASRPGAAGFVATRCGYALAQQGQGHSLHPHPQQLAVLTIWSRLVTGATLPRAWDGLFLSGARGGGCRQALTPVPGIVFGTDLSLAGPQSQAQESQRARGVPGCLGGVVLRVRVSESATGSTFRRREPCPRSFRAFGLNASLTQPLERQHPCGLARRPPRGRG
jgi:hypothetical protein